MWLVISTSWASLKSKGTSVLSVSVFRVQINKVPVHTVLGKLNVPWYIKQLFSVYQTIVQSRDFIFRMFNFFWILFSNTDEGVNILNYDMFSFNKKLEGNTQCFHIFKLTREMLMFYIFEFLIQLISLI